MFYNVIVTSYVTDLHDFGINEKKRPFPILWYKKNIYFGCVNFKITGGGNHPLRKTCYKKGSGRRGLITKISSRKMCIACFKLCVWGGGRGWGVRGGGVWGRGEFVFVCIFFSCGYFDTSPLFFFWSLYCSSSLLDSIVAIAIVSSSSLVIMVSPSSL